MASFSPRSATRTARIGPSGGVWSPNRLMSALLNGRSHANALPATNQVWLPCRSPTVTSGRSVAIRAASSTVAIPVRYAAARSGRLSPGGKEDTHDIDDAADHGRAAGHRGPLQPVPPLEHPIEREPGHEHERDREDEADLLAEPGVGHVHPVEPGDERRHRDDRRPAGDLLGDDVHPV